jgi:hypothetical protein
MENRICTLRVSANATRPCRVVFAVLMFFFFVWETSFRLHAQCVNLAGIPVLGSCGLTDQTFTNQTGSRTMLGVPNPTCSWGTGGPGTSTWISFTYVGPPTQQYLQADQAPGGAGNDPGIAIYSANGCTLLGCAADNANPGACESATAGKIDLTTLGLTVGNPYLMRVYNEGNTSNVRNPVIRCVPSSPCGDTWGSPCMVTNVNTTFTSSTNGAHASDGCAWPTDMFGAVPQLNCPGPGAISVDGNMWFQFSVCANGTVTITVDEIACNNTAGSQVWLLQGSCPGGTASFTMIDCEQSGDMTSKVLSAALVAGQTYYVLIDSYAGNCCDVSVTMTGPVCVTLAADLLGFRAIKETDGRVKVDWNTAEIQEPCRFHIERAKATVGNSSGDFETVATVDATPSQTQMNSFGITDQNAAYEDGLYYYRLSHESLNGEITHMAVTSVSLGADLSGLEIHSIEFDNVSDLISIQYGLLQDAEVRMELIDRSGNVAWSSGVLHMGKGFTRETFSVSHLSSGMYFFALHSDGRHVASRVLILK